MANGTIVGQMFGLPVVRVVQIEGLEMATGDRRSLAIGLDVIGIPHLPNGQPLLAVQCYVAEQWQVELAGPRFDGVLLSPDVCAANGLRVFALDDDQLRFGVKAWRGREVSQYTGSRLDVAAYCLRQRPGVEPTPALTDPLALIFRWLSAGVDRVEVWMMANAEISEAEQAAIERQQHRGPTH